MYTNLSSSALGIYQQQSDQQLVTQAGQGDREAFATLYKRYFQGIYDFTARITRDRDDAKDMVQTTFVKAWQQLGQGKRPRNIKAWLYTVARNASIDELRYQQRLVPHHVDGTNGRTSSDFAVIDHSRFSDPQTALLDKETAELVWRSAAALNPKEYSLLDLHVRQGLSADELAESLGLSKGAVYTKLSRLRDSLEEAVVSNLLMRRGRRDCPALDALMTELQATELTRKVRWTVRDHLKDCPRCQESKRGYASPVAVLGALIPVSAPLGARDLAWFQISDQLGSGPFRGHSRQSGANQIGAQKMVVAGALTAVVLAMALGAAAWFLWPPRDPADVHSTSHVVGQSSGNNRVGVQWSAQFNAKAYSVQWSRDAQQLPDTIADLPGTAIGTSSPVLMPGIWYFNLRTQARNGRWTSTVHLGPFVVAGPPPLITPDPVITPVVPIPTEPQQPVITPTTTAIPAVENSPPLANDDSSTSLAGAPITINVGANDSDLDGNLNLNSVAIISGPANGSAQADTAGQVTYSPYGGFVGTDSFLYQICDGIGACDMAAVMVTVVGNPPQANDDSGTTSTGVPVTINVGANDSDIDGDLNLNSVVVVGAPASGTAQTAGAGQVTYSPNFDFAGTDSFVYQICDNVGACSNAAVVVNVTNSSPLANDDNGTTPAGTSVTINVVANDNDFGGDLNPASVSVVGGPANGSAQVTGVGQVTYGPDYGFAGTDSFIYQVCDNFGACSNATVVVIVTNSPPLATDDSADAPEDTPVLIDVVANDSDPDGNLDPASVDVISGPDHGTSLVDTAGRVTYSSNLGFSGSDTFVYQLCDNVGACDIASVTITVLPAPVPDNHFVDIVGLNPNSPAFLNFGGSVNVSFNYSTTEAGGVRIFVRPFAGGALAPNYNASASPEYSSGDGSGSSNFSIVAGGVVIVDQLRIQMYTADQSELLYEDFVPVSFKFTNPVPPFPIPPLKIPLLSP